MVLTPWSQHLALILHHNNTFADKEAEIQNFVSTCWHMPTNEQEKTIKLTMQITVAALFPIVHPSSEYTVSICMFFSRKMFTEDGQHVHQVTREAQTAGVGSTADSETETWKLGTRAPAVWSGEGCAPVKWGSRLPPSVRVREREQKGRIWKGDL